MRVVVFVVFGFCRRWQFVKKLEMEDPLIVILGIGGDYHNHDKSQNLVRIGTDCKRCIKVFNGGYNYSIFYQNETNKNVYKRKKIDLETAQISTHVKTEWEEAEILKFFGDPRDVYGVVNNNHDGLIVFISSHGESGGVILDYDSDGEEVSLMEIYWIFTRDECPYLKDKPKNSLNLLMLVVGDCYVKQN